MFSVIAMSVTMMAQTGKVDSASVVDRLARVVEEGYSYPEIGKRMAALVRKRQRDGAYRAILRPDALAEQLTRDLRSVSHDLHLRVRYSPEVLPKEGERAAEPAGGMEAEAKRVFGPENYGLRRAEVLDGNVGYLDFRYFAPLVVAKDAYDAGMRLVSNTDALIIDLRQNGGSMDPATIPYLLGYLFRDPVHTIDMIWGRNGKPESFWTAKDVGGPKYLDKKVYLLTSGRTFSGAEEFAYDLKSYRRATLIGETTGGGANPGGDQRVDDHWLVWLPMGIVKGAVTGTNWEGVGVRPDFEVPAITAFDHALRTALKTIPGERARRALAELPPSKSRKVMLRLKGHPAAKEVFVAGSFNYWQDQRTPMRRDKAGWSAMVTVEEGRTPYKFIVDGRWIADPANPRRQGPNGDSVLEVR